MARSHEGQLSPLAKTCFVESCDAECPTSRARETSKRSVLVASRLAPLRQRGFSDAGLGGCPVLSGEQVREGAAGREQVVQVRERQDFTGFDVASLEPVGP